MRSEKLHVLIAIASLIVALRGLQVLQLFGVIPKIRGRSASPACAFSVNPAPPFPAADESRAHQQLLHWLKRHDAVVDGVLVHEFDGLRGLRATRDFDVEEVLLSIPTKLTISIGTFSAAAAAAGSPHLRKLLGLPDGDMYLEAVALLYEALLHGSKQCQAGRPAASNGTSSGSSGSNSDGSKADEYHGFGSYLITLPRNIDLPVFIGNSDLSCAGLLTALPHLQRLTEKRLAGVTAAWPRVQALLKALPKPSPTALGQLKPCEAWQAFLWAYSVAQTRVVTLDVEDLPDHVNNMLQQQGIADVGVMVPLLDMANHGSGEQVNARVMGDGTAFRLVVTRPIQKGQQVFISYNTADDDSPNCSWRWLLEYGFVPNPTSTQQQQQQQSKHDLSYLQRQCYGFNLTAAEVVARCPIGAVPMADSTTDSNASGTSATIENSQDQKSMQQQQQQWLAASGLKDATLWVDLNAVGLLHEGVVDWIAHVLRSVQGIPKISPKAAEISLQAADKGDSSSSGSASSASVRFGPCGCGCYEHSAGSVGQESPSSSSSSSDGGSCGSSCCVATCVLQRVLQEKRQQLQEAIRQAEQAEQQQQQQQQSCAALEQQDTGEDIGHHSNEIAGLCSAIYNVPDSSSSINAINGRKVPRCGTTGLLQVAYDADAALAATISRLQQLAKQ